MHRVAAIVETWRRQRRAGTIARVISAQGLGPSRRDEFVVIDADGRTTATSRHELAATNTSNDLASHSLGYRPMNPVPETTRPAAHRPPPDPNAVAMTG